MAEPGGSAATSVKERKFDYPTEAHEKADDLLARIAVTADLLLDLSEQRKTQADLVDEMFKAPISARKHQLAALIKALEKLMKVNRYKLLTARTGWTL